MRHPEMTALKGNTENTSGNEHAQLIIMTRPEMTALTT